MSILVSPKFQQPLKHNYKISRLGGGGGGGGGGGIRREGLCWVVSFCRLRQPIAVLQLWPELSLEGFTRNVYGYFLK